ncbi:spore germination protein [Paenibacillus curdlanolyticus YK9]|uniref:Spore germination protein n=1 Tax=Paenibacillus curdlanolyticus YK9 TaxID=717606 RepID=E0IA76_9BACL|nr:endospore germination permease [Paenibacillus curdlanolyticus]EFM10653.1 spore germination protein [Paenibacillus curdlanolyticus YK9]
MSEAPTKINILQLFMIFALMNGLADHVIINPMLLDASGRDAWITVLLTGALFVLWSLLITWMMRKSGQVKWQDWIAKQTHPIVSWILLLPVGVMLYLIGATTVIHTSKWNTANYLPATPGLIIVLSLILICLVLALWGMSTIAITAGMLLPIVTLLGIFVSVFNATEKDHRLLKPVLEKGWSPVADGMLYAAGGFVEIILLLLLQHRLVRKVKAWQVLLYSLFTVLIMVGPIIGAITEFGPTEAANQMTSPYEQWRLIKIGQYIEHVDFFSIFQWLSGACIRVSLAVYLLVDIAPFKRNSHRQWAIAAIMLSYLVIALFPLNDYSFYEWMYRIYMPVSFGIMFTVSIIWMGITLVAKPMRKGESS